MLNSTIYKKNNQGFALATSLLLLLVMTMVGISMFAGVNTQEKVSVNTRIKNRTMLTADSSVQQNWTLGILSQRMLDKELTPQEIDKNYNQDAISLSGNVSICFLGEDAKSPGNEVKATFSDNEKVTWKQSKFFAAAHVAEVATGASTTIEQGGFMLLPSTGRSSNCNQAIIDNVTEPETESSSKPIPETL